MTQRQHDEDKIQRSIIDYIEAVIPHALVFAIPNAARRSWRGRATNAVSGLKRGAPDLCVCLSGGEVLWIEVKSDNGRLSQDQLAFAGKLRALKHNYILARSIDDVRISLLKLGIETREHHG